MVQSKNRYGKYQSVIQVCWMNLTGPLFKLEENQLKPMMFNLWSCGSAEQPTPNILF